MVSVIDLPLLFKSWNFYTAHARFTLQHMLYGFYEANSIPCYGVR